ncbi:MAG: zinc-dependent peptidase [Fluviicola sp.]|nr:zinc-dependent peptidase [Fluviicola sp.]
MQELLTYSLLVVLLVIAAYFYRKKKEKQRKLSELMSRPFPEKWRSILLKKVLFYRNLEAEDKQLFEKQVLRFLATKKIEAVSTTIDDTVRLMVASSAVIPTFAFPNFNYPAVRTVLIYPGSFDEDFDVTKHKGHRQFITGMVGNKALKGTVILSKPDLLAAYNGSRKKSNVGIHEFVHLMDGTDGAIDGIPERLLDHSYVASWLFEIKDEMEDILKGKSDINPYGLTNNAEFLAVVSEYFFENPKSFKKKHPDLYKYMVEIFDQKL